MCMSMSVHIFTRFGQQYPICFNVEFLILINPFITKVALEGTKNMLSATSVIWFRSNKLNKMGSNKWLGTRLHNSFIFLDPNRVASSARTFWHRFSKERISITILTNGLFNPLFNVLLMLVVHRNCLNQEYLFLFRLAIWQNLPSVAFKARYTQLLDN